MKSLISDRWGIAAFKKISRKNTEIYLLIYCFSLSSQLFSQIIPNTNKNNQHSTEYCFTFAYLSRGGKRKSMSVKVFRLMYLSQKNYVSILKQRWRLSSVIFLTSTWSWSYRRQFCFNVELPVIFQTLWSGWWNRQVDAGGGRQEISVPHWIP